MAHNTTTLVVLSVGALFAITSLALVATSFGTDHWVDVTVDRDGLGGTFDATEQLYFTRGRGMFRTCYEGEDKQFLNDLDNLVDGTCETEQGYELQRRPETSNWGDDYDTRIHLMRCHFAFFVIAMVMLMIGIVTGSVGCWGAKPRPIRVAGLFVFLGAFCAAGGMAFFHGYEYLEREKITEPAAKFPAYWNKVSAYVVLQDNSSIGLGFSYILGWVGMGIGAISAMLYLVAAYLLTDRHYRHHKHPYDDYTLSGRPLDEPYPGYPPNTDMMMYPGSTVPAVQQPYILPSTYPGYDYNAGYANGGYKY